MRVALPAAVLLLAAVLPSGLGTSAHDITPGPSAPVVGFDMLPDAANTGTGLGTIDPCFHADNAGGTRFSIDVWLDAVPSDEDVDGYDYSMNFPSEVIQLAERNTKLFLPDAVDDFSGAVPATQSPYSTTVANLSPTAAPAPGGARGVLGRYTFEVKPGAAAGSYLFTLGQGQLDLVNSTTDTNWWYGPDTEVGTADDKGADIWDGSHSPIYGVLALGSASCSTLPTPAASTSTPESSTPAASGPGQSPTAGASTSPGASSSPTGFPGGSGSPSPATSSSQPASESGGSSFPWLPVVIGVVVAIGVIGAAGFFALRRRRQP